MSATKHNNHEAIEQMNADYANPAPAHHQVRRFCIEVHRAAHNAASYAEECELDEFSRDELRRALPYVMGLITGEASFMDMAEQAETASQVDYRAAAE